jgi:hypothetical protein
LHIAGSTCRVQKGESLRDKWNEWLGGGCGRTGGEKKT